MDVVIYVGRTFNQQYNEAPMATTGMELQPTLPSPLSHFTPEEGMNQTPSKSCKKCKLHISSLSRSQQCSFKQFILQRLLHCSQHCLRPSWQPTYIPRVLNCYLFVNFPFSPILKATYIDFELLSLQEEQELGCECQFLVAETQWRFGFYTMKCIIPEAG